MTTSLCWSMLVKLMRRKKLWQWVRASKNNESLGYAGIIWSVLKSVMQQELKHSNDGFKDIILGIYVVHFYVLGVPTVPLPQLEAPALS